MDRRDFLKRSGLAVAGLAAASMKLPSVLAEPLGSGLHTGRLRAASSVRSTPSCLWGAHVQVPTGGDLKTALTALETKLGRTLGLVRRDYPWTHPLVGGIDSWLAAGGRIPLVSWLARDTNGTQIPWTRIAGGNEDAWIRTQALTAKAFGSPLHLIFHHEPENESGTPADYIAAWRRIHDIFTQAGVTNVTWIMALMAVTYGGRNGGADTWYPGDFIDVLGADGYNWFPVRSWADWESFQVIFQGAHDYALNKGKPLYAVEWGCLEQNSCGYSSGDPAAKAAWFTAARDTIKSWPQVKGLSYSHTVHDVAGNTADWRVTTSRKSVRSFRAVGQDPYFN